MPWDDADAARKTHRADTPKKKRQWRHIANSALRRGESEGAAIRMANGVIRHGGKRKKKRHGRSLSR